METQRPYASYLPDNMDFVAKNNGLERKDLISILLNSKLIAVSVGFFAALPLCLPVDPRHRINCPKMNPSRVYTPEVRTLILEFLIAAAVALSHHPPHLNYSTFIPKTPSLILSLCTGSSLLGWFLPGNLQSHIPRWLPIDRSHHPRMRYPRLQAILQSHPSMAF